MNKQRGIITWDLLIIVIVFGSATATTPAMERFHIANYPTLDSCLAAVDGYTSAMSAVRPGEIKGRAVIEWKARCVPVGAP